MSNVFISYRREDSGGYALALGQNLRRRLGADHVFMDIESIEPGVDFVQVIEEAVGECVVLLAVIGPRWVDISGADGRRIDDPADFVALEIATALERNIRVIPVLINQTPMPESSQLPDRLKALARRNAIQISSTRFETDVDRLVATIERVLEREKERQATTARTLEQERDRWIRDLKLELGRIIDQENARPLPPHLASLLPPTTLDIVLEERLVHAAESEMEEIQAELTESCRRHGLLYDRAYYIRLWENQDPEGPPFQVSAHAEHRHDVGRPTAVGRTVEPDAIPTADPNATQLFGRAAPAWDPGRWLLLAKLDGLGQQVFRLTSPVSTVGRASDQLESLANCVLTGAPPSISRRQLAVEWESVGGAPGFRVYNLGAAPIEVGEKRIPGAKVGLAKVNLDDLGEGHSAWIEPRQKVVIGGSMAELWVEEVPAG